MDAKSDLLKEAIADAKAVKETALANAKIALEEAFAPRIQSMLSTKLAEELDEEEEDLAAAAAEMSAAEVEPAPAEPAPEMEAEPMIDGGEAEISMDAPAEEEALDIDMSEGDYSIEEEDSSVAEDLELEAIIRELEEDLNEEDLTEEEIHEEEINEEDAVDAEAEDDLTTEELNIDEIIESILSEEDDMPTEGRMMKDEDEDPSDDHSNPKEGRGDKKVEEALEEELSEAYDTIESLRDTINEVNLLKMINSSPVSLSPKLVSSKDIVSSQSMFRAAPPANASQAPRANRFDGVREVITAIFEVFRSMPAAVWAFILSMFRMSPAEENQNGDEHKAKLL